MNTNVLRAVFTRNFVSYFANPTGYVFICVFVLLSSFAAFWPHEFFNSNLANLDQLNRYFPLIMLVFIPAITMSVWAEERRLGTDELLLTVPAGDFDIVLGKYLAAVAIFSVSLLFSLFCNFIMLAWLSQGQLDGGLFLGTYVGYWLVGLAMLAVGMIASFVTDNLTVAFILGAALNAPLVLAMWADAIFGPTLARLAKQWSIGRQFGDFGRGMVSLSGIAYFLLIVVVMLYLSMVLIGRRHWARGRDRGVMAAHYGIRTLSLAVLAISAIIFFHDFDLRYDATREKLSSLSPETGKLLANLDLGRPVQVDAFISPTVPELYVQARLDLVTMLRELQARGGSEVQIRIHDTERFSEEAALAEERFNITPRRVVTMRRGTLAEDYIFMGVAFTCGLEKVVLPFIDRGIPAEYEVVRSICTVTQQKRKKIGIVQTDAQLYGRFNMQTMSSSPNWPIIDELEKMYDVVQVDPTSQITEQYDALLAVQPSSLGPEQLTNLVAAIRKGTPTAIFEDPFPGFASHVPGTSQPRRPPTGMNPMMMRQQMPKGNIEQLWQLLGVDFAADQIIWQNYNPYPKLDHLPSEMVFVDRAFDAKEPFNDSQAISSKLEMLLFPFPGSVAKLHSSPLEFDPLVQTGTSAGTVRHSDMLNMSPFGPRGLNPNRRQIPTNMPYVLAAHIMGRIKSESPADDDSDNEGDTGSEDETTADQEQETDTDKETQKPGEAENEEAEEPAEKKPGDTKINVVLVADIDMLHREFFLLREQGTNPEAGIELDFDNVTFVLNILDVLAGDEKFVNIRKRRPKHFTLRRIDDFIEQARTETTKTADELQAKFEEVRQEEQEAMDKRMDKLREDMTKKKIDAQEITRRVAMALRDGQRRMNAKVEQLEDQQKRRIQQIETEQALEIRRIQNTYKSWAVALPPIPPLIVAVIVFFSRRAREREGVARSRLR